MATTVQVKQEQHDEAEIRELAAKMTEQHKQHMAKQQQIQQQQVAAQQRQMAITQTGNVMSGGGASGQPSILSYLGRGQNAGQKFGTGVVQNNNHSQAGTSKVGGDTEAGKDADSSKTSDEESQKGHFGWCTFENGKVYIPYIMRQQEKYCAVRMVEMKVLNKYLNYLHQDIYCCTCVRSYYITEAESRLLNEINQKHCDFQFGRDTFTVKDLVVRLSDANKFYQFLDVCHRKLQNGSSTPNEKCGFIRINKESVVPYTIRNDTQKMVPLFYFEGETENLKMKADYLSGWDLSYLKFCCKVQGIRNELFSSDSVQVISLADIKGYFPQGTTFEDYWPSKMVDSGLLIGPKSVSSNGHWTKIPTHPPPKVMSGGVPPTKNNMTNIRKSVPAYPQNATQSAQRLAAQSVQSPSGIAAAVHVSTLKSAPSSGNLKSALQQALTNGWNINPELEMRNQQLQMARNMAAQSQRSFPGLQANNQSQMPNLLANSIYNPYGASTGLAQISRNSTQVPPPLVRQAQSQSAAAHMSSCVGGSPTLLRSENSQLSPLIQNAVAAAAAVPMTANNSTSNIYSSLFNHIANCSDFRARTSGRESSSLMFPKAPNTSMATISIGSPTRASPKGAQAKQPPGLIPVANSNKSHVGYITKEVELLREAAGANATALAPPFAPKKAAVPVENHFDQFRQKSVITSRSSMDVIDLSSPPRSQIAAAAYQQQQQQPNRTSGMSNGRGSMDCGASSSSQRGVGMQQQSKNEKYTVIPQLNSVNIPSSYSSFPAYKVQKAMLEKTVVQCINMNAYSYNDLLLTITDLNELFMPHPPSIEFCKKLLSALDIQLYKGNRMQYQLLQENGKIGCDGVPLVLVNDIVNHMPQLTYMIRNQDMPVKRARIS